MTELTVSMPATAWPGVATDVLAAPGSGAGSLDDRTALAVAGEILEGGPDAFRRRRDLDGF